MNKSNRDFLKIITLGSAIIVGVISPGLLLIIGVDPMSDDFLEKLTMFWEFSAVSLLMFWLIYKCDKINK